MVKNIIRKIGVSIENIVSINLFEPFDDWEVIRFKEIWELISGRDLSPSEYNDEMAFNILGDAHIARQIMAILNTFNLNSEFFSYCICF